MVGNFQAAPGKIQQLPWRIADTMPSGGDDMKNTIKRCLAALLLGLGAPYILLCILWQTLPEPQEETVLTTAAETETAPAAPELTLAVQLHDGQVTQMGLNDYITGVVLAEMPAQFETQALKAQAVVARTYALKRSTVSGKHPQAAVCTDPACCQAYCAPADFLANGQTQEELDKVAAAVAETQNEVLTYDGALIEATYFSCSGGRTEDAQAVWGEAIVYLQATDSPGEENAAHYIDTVTFTTDDFTQRLSAQDCRLGQVSYTAGGGVKTIVIGGKSYTGTEVRSLLGLRSTAFAITVLGSTVTVTTKGYGHRVGMSQYGADAMAVGGSSYEQILAHYYPGTTLEPWQEN